MNDFYDPIANEFVDEGTLIERFIDYEIEYLDLDHRTTEAHVYADALDVFREQLEAAQWDLDVQDDADADIEEEEAAEDYGEVERYFGEADDLLEFFDMDGDEEYGEYEFSFEYEEAA